MSMDGELGDVADRALYEFASLRFTERAERESISCQKRFGKF
jgi:hypothetical protein